MTKARPRVAAGAARAARLDDSFQKLLLEFSAAAARGDSFESLLRMFCRATRKFFKVSGVYCWKLESPAELVGVEGDGHMARQFRNMRLRVDSGATLSGEIVKERRTSIVNHAMKSRYSVARQFKAQSLMATPLIIGGEVIGTTVFLHASDPEFFKEDHATKATILAGQLGSLMEISRLARSSKQEQQRAEDEARQYRQRAQDLVGLALEMNSSVPLPEFVRNFTQRVSDMVGAKAAALSLSQQSSLETVMLYDPARQHDKGILRRLNIAMSSIAAQKREAIITAYASELLGQSLADTLGWKELTVVRLTGSDGELLGVMCLAERKGELSGVDRNLLQALAAHASVALENSRLFTRMAQATRHWVEVFDSITDYIVVHDENHKVLRVNRSLADFIGTRPPELIGVSMRALLTVGEESKQPCPFCRVGAGAMDEYIHPVLERTYLVSTSRIHGASNEGFQTIHVLKDISDRREAERRYRELFDNIQEGLFFSTPEGRFLEVNDAMVRMLGYDSREELLKANVTQQLYVSADERRRFRDELEAQGMLRNFEGALRRKDGSLIHTLRNVFAVRDAQGNITQFRGLMLDITNLKNSQAELQRERDFNNKILNATQSLILVVDTAGLISYANRRWFEGAGYAPAGVLGKKISELVAPNRRSAMEGALADTLAGRAVDNLELPILRGDGRAGQFSINMSPMRDEQGAVNSVVVIMTDITDSATLQAKLMHTEKMAAVGQLVSGVAHEVNNPLTAIMGFSDLLLDHPEVPAAAKEDLKTIINEAQRTKQIVQNLLSFARQMPPQRQPIQLNSVLRRTLQLRSYDFSNHGVKVREKFQEDLPEVIGDAQQIQQVFLNIVNNAYDAVQETGRAGEIEVETFSSGGHVEVLFRDNGTGIAHPDRIFDPFFTTKPVGKGTGLGLSICYGILKAHGGEITCSNNRDREGATFLVRMPVAREMAMAAMARGQA